MRIVLVSALLVFCAGVRPSDAQENDAASLDRIRAALAATADSVKIVPPIKSWGGMTLVQPDITGGQIVQVRVPVGEFVMKAARAVGNARYERAQWKAHEQVARELQDFLKQQK